MIRKLLSGIAAVSIVIGLNSCGKDDVPANPFATDLTGLFTEIEETPQSFSVTAGVDATIVGSRGTIITFDPTSFKDASGNVITSGTINIQLTEAYTPGQMIMNGVTTTTLGNNPLMSGGSVNIIATNATQQEVFANDYSISFKQPADNDQSMRLYTGLVDTTRIGANVKWNDSATNFAERAAKDTSGQVFYYEFDSCTNFNWINCDYFYSAPSPKTDISVVMPDASFNQSNTQVFVIFPTLNMVTSMYNYDTATHTFKFGYDSYFLPVGTNIKVVVLAAKGTLYYMDVQSSINVTAGMSVSTTMPTQSLTQIKTALSSL